MHIYRSNQSAALMTRWGTDFRYQYGIFGGESQTSFMRNTTRAGSEEGRLFSRAKLVGEGKSLNGREKKLGEEKSRMRRRAPGDKVLTNQFQTVRVILASDWCQKTFFSPSQSSKTRSCFASSYTIDTTIGQLLAMFHSRRKVPITAQHVGLIVQHIRKKLAANTQDLSQVS